jgi:hypothetical protein
METENKQTVIGEWDSKPIGTEERQKLSPKDVVISGVGKITLDTKKGKSDKVEIICKHPDKQETIKISDVEYIESDKVETKALWLNLDSKGELSKYGALAALLSFYGAPTIRDLVGKTIKTDMGANGYLCAKAY